MKKLFLPLLVILLVGAGWWGVGSLKLTFTKSEHPAYELKKTKVLSEYLGEQKFWDRQGVWNSKGSAAVSAKSLTIILTDQLQEGQRSLVKGERGEEIMSSFGYREERGRVTMTIHLDSGVVERNNYKAEEVVSRALARAIALSVYRGEESFEVKSKRGEEAARSMLGKLLVTLAPRVQASMWQRIGELIAPRAYAQYTWQCGTPANYYNCSSTGGTCDPDDSQSCIGGSCDLVEVCTTPYFEESSNVCGQGCPPGKCYEPSGSCSAGMKYWNSFSG